MSSRGDDHPGGEVDGLLPTNCRDANQEELGDDGGEQGKHDVHALLDLDVSRDQRLVRVLEEMQGGRLRNTTSLEDLVLKQSGGRTW